MVALRKRAIQIFHVVWIHHSIRTLTFYNSISFQGTLD